MLYGGEEFNSGFETPKRGINTHNLKKIKYVLSIRKSFALPAGERRLGTEQNVGCKSKL